VDTPNTLALQLEIGEIYNTYKKVFMGLYVEKIKQKLLIPYMKKRY